MKQICYDIAGNACWLVLPISVYLSFRYGNFLLSISPFIIAVPLALWGLSRCRDQGR